MRLRMSRVLAILRIQPAEAGDSIKPGASAPGQRALVARSPRERAKALRFGLPRLFSR
jgi:hypothetical protein